MRLVVAIAVLMLTVSGSAVCGAGLEVPLAGIPKLELELEMVDVQPEWTLATKSKTQANYTWQGYILELKAAKQGAQQVVSFKLTRQGGGEARLKSYTARAFVPATGLHAVTVPCTRSIGNQLVYYHQNHRWRENVPVYRNLTSEGFQEKAIVNNEAPFILLTDNHGDNMFSIGWALADTATWLQGDPKDGSYILTLTRRNDQPFAGSSVEDALIINSARRPWMDVETDYAKQFDRYNGRKHDPVPDWAYDPVFCTWYCWSENIDQEMMLKAAGKCKELGITTFLVDAGWDKKPGEWWGDLKKGGIGDYAASPELFPDLPGMVKQMHDMGLRVELWAAPFWQAAGSKTYQTKTKDWMVWTKDGEDVNICPKYPGTRVLLKEQFARMARDFDIDGMWLDTADGVPPECSAKHEHLDEPMGKAWVDCLAAVREGLRSVKPDAITEARILHANLNSKRALDVVQCGDSPRSYEMIRLALIHLKPWAYDAVVKNDPMIWTPKTYDDAPNAVPPGTRLPSEIGKYLATMVTIGVPALSVDVLKLTDEETLMIKKWLQFYKEHRQTLIKGKFSLFGESCAIPDMMTIGKDEAVVYMKNPKTRQLELPKQVSRIYLLNCTDSDTLQLDISGIKGDCRITTHRHDWSETGIPSQIRADGTLRFSGFVPQGGAALITCPARRQTTP